MPVVTTESNDDTIFIISVLVKCAQNTQDIQNKNRNQAIAFM